MWPTKMKVDWPYNEIGWKMANGQLLFCALMVIIIFQKAQSHISMVFGLVL